MHSRDVLTLREIDRESSGCSRNGLPESLRFEDLEVSERERSTASKVWTDSVRTIDCSESVFSWYDVFIRVLEGSIVREYSLTLSHVSFDESSVRRRGWNSESFADSESTAFGD